jgi:hypothetical protein
MPPNAQEAAPDGGVTVDNVVPRGQ